MTLENQCLLAHRCRVAGQTEFCTPLCLPYKQLHGEKGTGGLLRLSELPGDYTRITARNLPFREENPDAYAVITRYCENIAENVRRGVGLYLYSVPNKQNPKGTGTGKTTAAAAMMTEYLQARVIQQSKGEGRMEGIPALFVGLTRLQNLFNAQFRGTRDMQEEAGLRYYRYKAAMCKADLLVIDDICVRGATDSFKGELYEIADTRAAERRATVFTSNESIDALGSLLNEQIASRIEGMTVPIAFVGTDNRKRGVL